jgi:hypothetical protein
VGLGVTFLDFCADSSKIFLSKSNWKKTNFFLLYFKGDSPLRAFLLDVCNVDDQDTGLNIHAMLGGLGSALGFILAAIDWKKTFFHYIGKQIEIIF